jgi:hypothetical protein
MYFSFPRIQFAPNTFHFKIKLRVIIKKNYAHNSQQDEQIKANIFVLITINQTH